MFTVFGQWADGGCDYRHVTGKRAAKELYTKWLFEPAYIKVWIEEGKVH